MLGFFQDKQKDPRSLQKKQENLASKQYTIILVLVAIYTKFATFNRFWWINFFFRKNPYFFTILFKFFQVLKNLTNSIAFYSKFVILSRFWWINFFPENPSFFQILLKFFELLKNLTNSIAFCNKFAMFCHFWKSSKFSENLFVFVKQLKFFEGFEKTGNFSCILLQNFQL